MRYVRPFNLDELGPGDVGPWLLAPEEGEGCSARMRRGRGAAGTATQSEVERIAIVLRGRAEAVPIGLSAPAGGVIFVPPGFAVEIVGSPEAVWLEIEAAPSGPNRAGAEPRSIVVDESNYQGTLFAHQSILDRTKGSGALRLNAMRVQPGAGSPDFHIHAFSQMYVIQEGEMTVDVGRSRYSAPAHSFVYLPAGVVHRNFNASGKVERHLSVLIPEPQPGDIFDFAVDIHDREAELITSVPV